MKATLKFTLPDDQHAFDCAQGGAAWQAEMRAFDEVMRNIVKHDAPPPPQGCPPLTQETWRVAVAILREEFLRHVAEAGGFVEE